MPTKFKKSLRELFNYYYPKEKDVTISEQEKIRLVEEWYDLDNKITSE